LEQQVAPFVSAPETAEESHWKALESDPDLQHLLAEKRRFIVPATIFFIVYYFALPVLVGYFPRLMSTKVVGNINLAYLFAVSEFVMTAVVIYLYVKRANHFDELADQLRAKVTGGARR
jgi:uncharacterized membrane protein (DUF485 family)